MNMQRMVKGSLFLDYVRMIKSRKRVDWTVHLTETDMELMKGRIDPSGWYPLETFERMGLGILKEVAGGDMEVVYAWGRDYMVDLFRIHEGLVAEGDPMQSLMRFKVLQRSFFSFEGIDVISLDTHQAILRVDYRMSPLAEEASAHQTMGFIERLLDRAGARNIRQGFKSKVWDGDRSTVIEFAWDL